MANARRFKKFNDAELFFLTIVLTDAREMKADAAMQDILTNKLKGKLKGKLDVPGLLNEIIEEVSRKERA
ncbi:hypothetical protein EBZ39_16440 [bacterium]|nr:hypothetical protein [bacterium]